MDVAPPPDTPPAVARKRVLVADDEAPVRAFFERLLDRAGYEVRAVATVAAAHEALTERVYDLVVSDYHFDSGPSGLDLLHAITQEDPTLPFIMITGRLATIADAVHAMQEGAYSYLSKPFEPDEFLLQVERAISHSEMQRELVHLRSELRERTGFEAIIGRAKALRDLFALVRRVAPSHSTVLIVGESGTGKELFARAIHQNSPRAGKPFIALNCAVVPETLLESELFGHEKGAFTGAYRAKKGLFEEASGGTLFLDEIGDLSLAVQTKLLRVLQEREVRPVGATRTLKVDTRVLCATNVSLDEAMAAGRFRPDLYYRIAVVPLVLPPLRARREDIPLLVTHFMRHYCRQNRVPMKAVSEGAMDLLMAAPWRGNVRELEHVIERTVLVTDGAVIQPEDLPAELRSSTGVARAVQEAGGSLREAVDKAAAAVERQSIRRALRDTAGNKTKAARLLGISRGSLYNKLRELGLES